MNPSTAHARVATALERGELVRQPCEVGEDCKGQVEAHHDDYDKPLEVRWLCVRHHRLHHSQNGPASNGRHKRAIRTNLTDDEWIQVKVAAFSQFVTIEQWVSDILRAVLKGAKP